MQPTERQWDSPYVITLKYFPKIDMVAEMDDYVWGRRRTSQDIQLKML